MPDRPIRDDRAPARMVDHERKAENAAKQCAQRLVLLLPKPWALIRDKKTTGERGMSRMLPSRLPIMAAKRTGCLSQFAIRLPSTSSPVILISKAIRVFFTLLPHGARFWPTGVEWNLTAGFRGRFDGL